MTNEEKRLEAKKRAQKCIEYACGRIVGEPDFITNQFIEFAELVLSKQWNSFAEARPEESKWYFVRFRSGKKILFEKAFYDLAYGWLCPNPYEGATVLDWMEVPSIINNAGR